MYKGSSYNREPANTCVSVIWLDEQREAGLRPAGLLYDNVPSPNIFPPLWDVTCLAALNAMEAARRHIRRLRMRSLLVFIVV